MKPSFLVATALLLFASVATAQSPRKNILFIGVDDLRVELGCYGAEYMNTPNLDSFARQGLLFEQAYCQQAVCAPSRISLMTGMRPDSTGVFDLDHPLNEALPDAMSMPRFFKENGYRTVSLGKIYHHGQDDKAFWDVVDPCSTPPYAGPKTSAVIAEKTKEAKKRKLKGKELRQFIKGPAFENADVTDSTYSDGVIADNAIEQLRQKDDRPFFLAVGFKKPHLPFVAPRKYWNMYDPAEIEIPARTPPRGAADQATTSWGELRAYAGIPAKEDLSDEQTRTLIHAYRACVSYIDAQVGRVLEEVDRQGLRENTIIVFWSDHGWKLGEYGDWCKHTNFELDTRVPLIFSGSGIPSGTRSRALVEYIDIYPTLAQWCGLMIPKACQGESLLPLFADPSLPGKQAALSQYPRGGVMGYSIRSGNWRYTRWQRKNGEVIARELYDHSRSDVATENIAELPGNADTVKQLDQRLLEIVSP
ncbi:sulfatase [Aporhodopirellula aestuarii]|uniref:Sulfatase n=1 Tax=Aporhodopirellula aestuarii TaxID=2950107 RepID=A0ABT0UCK2_9BACT|nr:sulfatase [Aporhodopirellula aestuarii]MCM2374752.1 sulfatase [Aporhodopirellula aestuarii]